MKGAWPDTPSPLSPDEIAGLAGESDLPSRFIRFRSLKSGWSVEHGPFGAPFFETTGEKNWSLLVQDVDSYCPEASKLWDRIPFLPFWRRDDVMVNFSTSGGNVGPHIDNYDVFLYQAAGVKRWEIGHSPVEVDDFRPEQPLRILKSFKGDETWDLEPGDILYLPARIPHYGIAVNDGITYSFGFRAPSLSEALLGSAIIATERLGETSRLKDAGTLTGEKKNPGEIDDAFVNQTLKAIKAIPTSPDDIRLWLAETLSTSLRLIPDPVAKARPESVAKKIAAGKKLFRNPSCRTFYFLGKDRVTVASQGLSFSFSLRSLNTISAFCNSDSFTPIKLPKKLSAEELKFLTKMISESSAYFE